MGTLKGSLATAFLIVVLGLGVWVFFYVTSLPLNFSETTFVVLVCAAIVSFGKWMWGRLRGTKASGTKAGTKA